VALLAVLLAAVLGSAPNAVAARSATVGASSVAAVSVAASASPDAVVVSPDPAHDLYVGTGGLVVPASAWRDDAASRSSVASCADCQWRVSVLCTKAEAAAGRCRTIDVSCPVGTVPVRIWLLRPGQDWAVVGHACQGPHAPVTLAAVGSSVRDRAEAALPALHAAVQPAAGTLVRVPALFRTGQPARGIRRADLSVLGLDVRLTARVRWHWDYGDGTTAWTSLPGGSWPDTSVSHTYLVPGTLAASVRSVWRGQFTVEGLGPFAVPGAALTQQAGVTVVVRAAHAHLVG
jgi:hypothetical protein